MIKNNVNFANKLNAKLNFIEQRMINVEQRLKRLNRFRSVEILSEKPLNEFQAKLFILFPAEHVTKPALQFFMEPVTFQPSEFFFSVSYGAYILSASFGTIYTNDEGVIFFCGHIVTDFYGEDGIIFD